MEFLMKLHVVLRTCDHSQVHVDWRTRYHGIPKPELLRGCVTSLVKSIMNVTHTGVKLTVLDDHSGPETVEHIKHIIQHVPNSEFIPLTESGYNHSAHVQWCMCRDSDADLVYSVEDDYLHCESAIQEMVDSWCLFKDRLNRSDIVLYPFDEPSEYNPPARTDYVVHGSARHWRTGIFTTNVLMMPPHILRDHWSLFECLALKYNGDYLNPRTEHYEESNTIWQIWNSGQAMRFNPIPSLALHMQFDAQKDPFIDWQSWWRMYAQ
jgi:hypothetical protein